MRARLLTVTVYMAATLIAPSADCTETASEASQALEGLLKDDVDYEKVKTGLDSFTKLPGIQSALEKELKLRAPKLAGPLSPEDFEKLLALCAQPTTDAEQQKRCLLIHIKHAIAESEGRRQVSTAPREKRERLGKELERNLSESSALSSARGATGSIDAAAVMDGAREGLRAAAADELPRVAPAGIAAPPRARAAIGSARRLPAKRAVPSLPIAAQDMPQIERWARGAGMSLQDVRVGRDGTLFLSAKSANGSEQIITAGFRDSSRINGKGFGRAFVINLPGTPAANEERLADGTVLKWHEVKSLSPGAIMGDKDRTELRLTRLRRNPDGSVKALDSEVKQIRSKRREKTGWVPWAADGINDLPIAGHIVRGLGRAGEWGLNTLWGRGVESAVGNLRDIPHFQVEAIAAEYRERYRDPKERVEALLWRLNTMTPDQLLNIDVGVEFDRKALLHELLWPRERLGVATHGRIIGAQASDAERANSLAFTRGPGTDHIYFARLADDTQDPWMSAWAGTVTVAEGLAQSVPLLGTLKALDAVSKLQAAGKTGRALIMGTKIANATMQGQLVAGMGANAVLGVRDLVDATSDGEVGKAGQAGGRLAVDAFFAGRAALKLKQSAQEWRANAAAQAAELEAARRTLDLKPGATLADAAAQRRNLAKRYHSGPQQSNPEAQQRMAEINAAYDTMAAAAQARSWVDGAKQFGEAGWEALKGAWRRTRATPPSEANLPVKIDARAPILPETRKEEEKQEKPAAPKRQPHADDDAITRKFNEIRAKEGLSEADLAEALELAGMMRDANLPVKPWVDRLFYDSADGENVPEFGIKLRVADAGDAAGRRKTLQAFLEAADAASEPIDFKIGLFMNAMDGSQANKFVTIFTRSPDAAMRLAEGLYKRLGGSGLKGELPPEDFPFRDSKLVSWRPAGFKSRTLKLKDADGREVEFKDNPAEPVDTYMAIKHLPGMELWGPEMQGSPQQARYLARQTAAGAEARGRAAAAAPRVAVEAAAPTAEQLDWYDKEYLPSGGEITLDKPWQMPVVAFMAANPNYGH